MIAFPINTKFVNCKVHNQTQIYFYLFIDMLLSLVVKKNQNNRTYNSTYSQLLMYYVYIISMFNLFVYNINLFFFKLITTRKYGFCYHYFTIDYVASKSELKILLKNHKNLLSLCFYLFHSKSQTKTKTRSRVSFLHHSLTVESLSVAVSDHWFTISVHRHRRSLTVSDHYSPVTSPITDSPSPSSFTIELHAQLSDLTERFHRTPDSTRQTHLLHLRAWLHVRFSLPVRFHWIDLRFWKYVNLVYRWGSFLNWNLISIHVNLVFDCDCFLKLTCSILLLLGKLFAIWMYEDFL